MAAPLLQEYGPKGEAAKKPSPPASLSRSPSKNWLSSSVLSHKSPFLPSSLPCVHASMPKYHNRRNDKPKSSDFEIFLQKWAARQPQQSISWILQLSKHHLWNAKARQEEQHNNSDGIGWHNVVFSQGSCCHCLYDLILPRSQQRHPSFGHLELWPHQTHYIQAHHKRITQCRLGNQGGHPPHWRPIRLAHTPSIQEQLGWCSSGVPQFSSSWWLVSGPVMSSSITFETSEGIQPQRLLKNAQPQVSQAHPQLHISNNFQPQFQALQSPWQCQDTNQRRWGHGLTS